MTRKLLPLGTAVLGVGVHTFSVYMREDGFMVDRVLITANANYAGVTQGGNMAGPAASGQSTPTSTIERPRTLRMSTFSSA